MGKAEKIKTVTIYKGTIYKLIKTLKNIKLYFSDEEDLALIADNNGNVLFVIKAESCQTGGYLQLLPNF